jgi:hypothetical protein
MHAFKIFWVLCTCTGLVTRFIYVKFITEGRKKTLHISSKSAIFEGFQGILHVANVDYFSLLQININVLNCEIVLFVVFLFEDKCINYPQKLCWMKNFKNT